MRKDRRTKEGYQLRVLIDALNRAKSLTVEQWIDEWVAGANKDTPYRSRDEVIKELETWIIAEANNMLIREAA